MLENRSLRTPCSWWGLVFSQACNSGCQSSPDELIYTCVRVSFIFFLLFKVNKTDYINMITQQVSGSFHQQTMHELRIFSMQQMHSYINGMIISLSDQGEEPLGGKSMKVYKRQHPVQHRGGMDLFASGSSGRRRERRGSQWRGKL